jgi:hypothetical protein
VSEARLRIRAIGISTLAIAVVIAVSLVAQHRNDDRAAYVTANVALLRGIAQFSGAREVRRTHARYEPGVEGDTTIKHVGWMTNARYALPAPARGASVERHFRRALAGWRCRFNVRRRNVPFGFTCTRGAGILWSFIGDSGNYEISIDHWRQTLARGNR